MAVYKVPQDVEADDKLLGPFSFRQFIYLIVTFIGIALAWGLSRVFIPLAIIPLPIIIFFGALALPLRKDQPMEVYLAAVVSFYLKPRRRLWQPDGVLSLVEITAPHVEEVQRSKNLSESEAEQRLSYLANLVDTGGWAVRGVASPEVNSAMRTDAYYEAQQTEDILDDNAGVARAFDNRISETDARHRQEMIDRLHQTVSAPAPVSVPPTPVTPAQYTDPYQNLVPTTPLAPVTTPPAQALPSDNPFLTAQAAQPADAPLTTSPQVSFNPYPTDIHQTVISPLGAQPAAPLAQAPQPLTPPADSTASTSTKVVSPDIINLANNSDLSIETIAHEAKRIQEREEKLSEEEVVISLR